MKKFLIILILLFLINPIFAKNIQCVKSYQVFNKEQLNVISEINQMIKLGWKVVSITPITKKCYESNPTDYIIVVFEREE